MAEASTGDGSPDARASSRTEDRERILAAVNAYYTAKLRVHGPKPTGVDWNSADSQTLRFVQLLRCLSPGDASLIDYGCGYGALCDHLRRSSVDCRYTGFDISAEMVAQAQCLHAHDPHSAFVSDEALLDAADYTVASGVFNVKLDVPDPQWRSYVEGVLERMDALSRRGFAFNALSVYSDPERRRSDLYYADPRELFDYCKRRFSRQVALLHDYPLFEFTIAVRKA
jgi:SAM-dependent methyltransferase